MEGYTCSVGALPADAPQMLASLVCGKLAGKLPEPPVEPRGLEGGRSKGGAGWNEVEVMVPGKAVPCSSMD